jgi:hypothetical protein
MNIVVSYLICKKPFGFERISMSVHLLHLHYERPIFKKPPRQSDEKEDTQYKKITDIRLRCLLTRGSGKAGGANWRQEGQIPRTGHAGTGDTRRQFHITRRDVLSFHNCQSGRTPRPGANLRSPFLCHGIHTRIPCRSRGFYNKQSCDDELRLRKGNDMGIITKLDSGAVCQRDRSIDR